MRMPALSDRLGRVGLRPRMVILVLLAAAPLLGLLIDEAITNRQFALANARESAVALARLGAQRQADMLHQARELLLTARRMSEIVVDDPETCRAALKLIAADHPDFYTIGVVDRDGIIACHSLITHRQAFGDKALFQQAMAPDAPAFVVGQFRISPITGKPTVLMASPLPKATDGTPRGMVFISLNLESFQQVSAELASLHHGIVLIIDLRTRTLLARAPNLEQMVGRTFANHALVRAMMAASAGGGVEAEGLDGIERIFGFAPLPGTESVMIAVGLSPGDVLADANRRLLLGLSIAVLALVGTLAAAWLFGDASQLRPIRRLVDTALKFGRGDLSARTAMEGWQAPEFRMLGSTLNNMAEAIALAQKHLRDSEAELRLLADNATDLIFKLDRDFRYVYVSPASREIVGYEPHELLGNTPADFADPHEAGTVLRSYHELLRNRERLTTVSRVRHCDGNWIWVEVHKRGLFDQETGAPIGVIGALRDISARKAAEDAVHASEALLRGVFDHTPDCILIISVAADRDFVLQTYNPAAATAIGCPVGDMNGRPVWEVLSLAVAVKIKDNLDRCLTTGQVLELGDEIMFGKKQRKWDVTLAPIFDEHAMVARIIITARETTEKKLAADLVRESQERYRLIADNVADLVVRLGHDFVCGFVSPASRDLLGYEPEELIALPLAEIVHPDDCEDFRGDLQALQTSGQIDEVRFRARHADGVYIWVEATGRKLAGSDSIILTIRDISRRKQIEDELAAANCQLKALASQDGLTGLANRRAFDEVFDAEWRRATQDTSPLGLIMLDVDRFKAFNDIYGHQAGDQCLCAVARAIQSPLRRLDFAARYGGEEFVIVLPGMDELGTVEIAEQIRAKVAAAGLEHRGNVGGIVTISAGIWASIISAPPGDPQDALKFADANLYAAKAAGRNRVVCGRPAVAKAG